MKKRIESSCEGWSKIPYQIHSTKCQILRNQIFKPTLQWDDGFILNILWFVKIHWICDSSLWNYLKNLFIICFFAHLLSPFISISGIWMRKVWFSIFISFFVLNFQQTHCISWKIYYSNWIRLFVDVIKIYLIRNSDATEKKRTKKPKTYFNRHWLYG